MIPVRRRVKKKAVRRKEFTTICERHGRIEDWADEIEEIVSDKKVGLKELRKLVKKLANKIKTEVQIAANSGQSMEDRLNEYKTGIEVLGFIRKK